MKPLELVNRNGDILDRTLDLGEWDIEQGLLKTIRLYNPNSNTVTLNNTKNEDPRLIIELPNEIPANTTRTGTIKILARKFLNDEDEAQFLRLVRDTLSGTVTLKDTTSNPTPVFKSRGV